MPAFTPFRLYLLGLALLFAGYVALEYNRPKPLDWTPTYANKDKIPYGTFVLFDQLPRLLGTDSVSVVRQPIYQQLTGEIEPGMAVQKPIISLERREIPDEEEGSGNGSGDGDSTAVATGDDAGADTQADSIDEASSDEASSDESDGVAPLNQILRPTQANYLFINQIFECSPLDARALLAYVAQGHNAFIAAEDFQDMRRVLRDSLGFDTEAVDLPRRRGARGLFTLDSATIRLSNPALGSRPLRLPGAHANQRLLLRPGRPGRTLATDAQGRPVLVRLNHGRGHFYLCTVPVAFTNYFVLRPRSVGFAAAALAYLPARPAWYDEYQKQGPLGEQSLLRVITAHPALRYAYYLALVGGLLFVLVEARRRQRIIPTIKPLPNTTLLFTRTVAGLYRQGATHGIIAEKKVSLFLDFLRTRLHEPHPDLNDEAFRQRLAQRAGVPRPRIDELLRMVSFVRTAPQVNDGELLKLSRALNELKSLL